MGLTEIINFNPLVEDTCPSGIFATNLLPYFTTGKTYNSGVGCNIQQGNIPLFIAEKDVNFPRGNGGCATYL